MAYDHTPEYNMVPFAIILFVGILQLISWELREFLVTIVIPVEVNKTAHFKAKVITRSNSHLRLRMWVNIMSYSQRTCLQQSPI